MFYSLLKGSNRRLKRNAHTYTQEIKRDWVYCGQRKKRGKDDVLADVRWQKKLLNDLENLWAMLLIIT